jgi:hypothetical protein
MFTASIKPRDSVKYPYAVEFDGESLFETQREAQKYLENLLNYLSKGD